MRTAQSRERKSEDLAKSQSKKADKLIAHHVAVILINLKELSLRVPTGDLEDKKANASPELGMTTSGATVGASTTAKIKKN